MPESLTFDEMPGDLHPEPKLSVRLAAGAPGKRTIRVSYLAQGFAWSSDYVARLERGNRMDLTGWVTLRNLTNSSFRDAQVQVVAGRLNLLYDEDGGTSTIGATEDYRGRDGVAGRRVRAALGELEVEREHAELDLAMLVGLLPVRCSCPAHRTRGVRAIALRGLWRPSTTMVAATMILEAIVVTGMRRVVATRETLGDYQLYRLPWSTDLNARQTKQAVFLEKKSREDRTLLQLSPR